MADLKYKRILLKLSGEALLGSREYGIEPETVDYIGMLATIMNSLALGSALSKLGIGNRVYLAFDMPKVCESYIRDKAISNLRKGRVVIAGAGR